MVKDKNILVYIALSIISLVVVGWLGYIVLTSKSEERALGSSVIPSNNVDSNAGGEEAHVSKEKIKADEIVDDTDIPKLDLKSVIASDEALDQMRLKLLKYTIGKNSLMFNDYYKKCEFSLNKYIGKTIDWYLIVESVDATGVTLDTPRHRFYEFQLEKMRQSNREATPESILFVDTRKLPHQDDWTRKLLAGDAVYISATIAGFEFHPTWTGNVIMPGSVKAEELSLPTCWYTVKLKNGKLLRKWKPDKEDKP